MCQIGASFKIGHQQRVQTVFHIRQGHCRVRIQEVLSKFAMFERAERLHERRDAVGDRTLDDEHLVPAPPIAAQTPADGVIVGVNEMRAQVEGDVARLSIGQTEGQVV